MHDTIKYPAVLVRKAVLTALVGIGCFLVGGIGFIVSHDRTLLALSAAVFVFSVYRAGRIALLVLNGKYDMVEGFCVGIAAKPFGKLRKINIMDTEKLTRRNMKQCVTEHIQTLCLSDPAFARLVMHPRKNMVNCFHFINRKARDFVKQEMEDNDEKPDGNGIYGSDVPDDLCYQWAEDYFRDPDAKEDEVKEEKFVPKPYVGKTGSSKAKKSEKKAKKESVKEKKVPEKEQEENIPGQISLLDLVEQEGEAG